MGRIGVKRLRGGEWGGGGGGGGEGRSKGETLTAFLWVDC